MSKSSRLSAADVSPEQLADLRRNAAEARAALSHKPGLEDVDFPDTVPFAGTLRGLLTDLKTARTETGMTLTAIAEKTGIAVETLSRLESGKITNPTWNTLGAYAAAMGRTLVTSIV